MPGVDPRRIGQPPEDALFEAAHEAVEGLRDVLSARDRRGTGHNRALAARRWRAVPSPPSVVSSLTDQCKRAGELTGDGVTG